MQGHTISFDSLNKSHFANKNKDIFQNYFHLCALHNINQQFTKNTCFQENLKTYVILKKSRMNVLIKC